MRRLLIGENRGINGGCVAVLRERIEIAYYINVILLGSYLRLPAIFPSVLYL